MGGMITTTTDYLSIDPSTVIPEIPGLPGFDLVNLLAGEIDDLVASASLPGFDFTAIPLMSDTALSGLDIPTMKALEAVQLAIGGYVGNLTTVVFDLVKGVTDDLEITAMPALPVPPTIEELYALLPPTPTIDDLAALGIPGYSFSLALPSPLVPSVNIPSYDLEQGIKNMYSGLSTETTTLLLDFIDTLPLGFTPPVLCVDI